MVQASSALLEKSQSFETQRNATVEATVGSKKYVHTRKQRRATRLETRLSRHLLSQIWTERIMVTLLSVCEARQAVSDI
jgi:hypothetical protein